MIHQTPAKRFYQVVVVLLLWQLMRATAVKDPGAIGPGNTYEKTVTLGIAHKLANLINNQPGMQGTMTRSRDNFVELDERSAIARHKMPVC